MMWIRACVAILVVGLGMVVAPEFALSFSRGAPAGFAGDIESGGSPRTCTACHTGNALNDSQGGGSVTIDAPDSAAPGETITITVTVGNGVGGSRQGFSAIVKDPSTSSFVGSYTLPDPGAVRLTDNDDTYVTHTSGSNTQTSWSFQWTAPSSDVPSEVVVYSAGNATNGDGSPSGDFIYTDTHTISLTSVASEARPHGDIGVEWASLAPNPIRTTARAELVLATPMDIAVRLVDGRGRWVRTVASGPRPAGTSSVRLDVRDLAPGTYFLVAETEAGRRTQAVSVVR